MRNPEEERRRRAREGDDPARVLLDRVRYGQLPAAAVEVAASLGREDAQIVYRSLTGRIARAVDWEVYDQRAAVIEAAAKLLGGRRWKRVAVRIAADFA